MDGQRAYGMVNNRVFEVLASGAFTSASTGVAEFDDGPVCNVTGQTPRFGVLYFDVQMGDFQGVVAIDAKGYVVWYYQARSALPLFASPLSRRTFARARARGRPPSRASGKRPPPLPPFASQLTRARGAAARGAFAPRR